MKIKYFKKPVQHFIIEDWMPEDINKQILADLDLLIPFMEVGVVGKDGKPVVVPEYKNNTNLWMFSFYRTHPEFGDLDKFIEMSIWTDQMKQEFKNTGDALFQSAVYSHYSTMLLSKYEEGGLYQCHRDDATTFTVNYMLATEPLKFEGGDFVLGTWEEEVDAKVIPFKNNQVVIFPSRVNHRVTPVTNFTGEPKDARFTIQYWPRIRTTPKE